MCWATALLRALSVVYIAATLSADAARVLWLDDNLQPCSTNGIAVTNVDDGNLYDVCIVSSSDNNNPQCRYNLYLKRFEWRNNFLSQLSSLAEIRTSLLVQCE
jgi:hypothetical protein